MFVSHLSYIDRMNDRSESLLPMLFSSLRPLRFPPSDTPMWIHSVPASSQPAAICHPESQNLPCSAFTPCLPRLCCPNSICPPKSQNSSHQCQALRLLAGKLYVMGLGTKQAFCSPLQLHFFPKHGQSHQTPILQWDRNTCLIQA